MNAEERVASVIITRILKRGLMPQDLRNPDKNKLRSSKFRLAHKREVILNDLFRLNSPNLLARNRPLNVYHVEDGPRNLTSAIN